ncbi:hypothetical protein ACFVT5_38670 [Streptomyces sp. NPDC058001]|uniref:hypothetical protein n=1 Tax=Streptomyces sp. NPDC058001 TaxID=3346300 RepID=UPI0036EEF16A
MRVRDVVTVALAPILLGAVASALVAAGPAVAVGPDVEREPVRLVVADIEKTGAATIATRPTADGGTLVTADVTKLTDRRGCVVLQADDGTAPGTWQSPRGQVLGMQCGTKGTTTRMSGETAHRQLRLRWLPADGNSNTWVSSPVPEGATTS